MIFPNGEPEEGSYYPFLKQVHFYLHKESTHITLLVLKRPQWQKLPVIHFYMRV